MSEIWRDIPMYRDIYEASSYGRIRSKVTGRITKDYYTEKGYKKVKIYLNGQCKSELVHRLVAFAFLPNPNNYPQVNHIDEDKGNNRLDNLEWCDSLYNNNYGSHKYYNFSKQSRPVIIDEIEFRSITKCAKYLNIPHGTLRNYLIGRNPTPSYLQDRGLRFVETR